LTVKGGRIGTKLGAWVQTIERLGEVKSDPWSTKPKAIRLVQVERLPTGQEVGDLSMSRITGRS
jgi:hypothetical protein